MTNKLEEAKDKLKKYNQEHLLYFYNLISEEEKENLINEILNLDIEKILKLYENSKKHNDKNYVLTPLKHYEKDKLSEKEIENYKKIGEREVKENRLAVVTMAGGQGTRLGFKGPKGTYEIKFKEKRKSLFEIVCEDIKRANKLYNVTIPWYIMVSKENKEQTLEYFKEKEYFEYDKKYITFFVQDTIPLIDVNGKIILQDYHKIKEVSNGNGNVFKALAKSNLIAEMKEKGIKWISFSGIDNILIKNVDTLFLGMIVSLKQEIASKSIFKEEPLEKTAVYCKKDGKPAILDYDDIDLNLSESKDENGMYLYREANMLSHIMSIDAVELVSTKRLPYHRAYKKNPIINEEGTKIVPTKPNTFKFENFIFDGFKYFDDMLLLRVNKDEEFAPIKDFTGIYTPETAKAKYEKYWENHLTRL